VLEKIPLLAGIKAVIIVTSNIAIFLGIAIE
jgi:hypothetical protein